MAFDFEWCKDAQDIEISMVILKVLLKLSCMISQVLVNQVTVVACISDIATIE